MAALSDSVALEYHGMGTKLSLSPALLTLVLCIAKVCLLARSGKERKIQVLNSSGGWFWAWFGNRDDGEQEMSGHVGKIT